MNMFLISARTVVPLGLPGFPDLSGLSLRHGPFSCTDRGLRPSSNSPGGRKNTFCHVNISLEMPVSGSEYFFISK